MIELPDYDGPGIYAIINELNGEAYIGSSRNIKARIRQHFSLLEKGRSASKKMQKAYSDGAELSIKICEKISEDKTVTYLYKRERHYMKLYDSHQHGYNEAWPPDYEQNYKNLGIWILGTYEDLATCPHEYGKSLARKRIKYINEVMERDAAYYRTPIKQLSKQQGRYL